MRLYHETSTEAAEAILAAGFIQSPSEVGVWVGTHPMAYGDALLAVEVPNDVLSKHGWVEEKHPDDPPLPPGLEDYACWIVPADILNRYPVCLVASTDSE